MRIVHVHCHVDKFSKQTLKNKDMYILRKQNTRILHCRRENIKGGIEHV